MNENHQRLCPSDGWAEFLHTDVLPRVTASIDLGAELLEIGPGPGAATEWLRHRVRRLVAVELDPEAGDRLRERFAGTNVEVVTANATRLDFDDASFDAVACFTMFHHVQTLAGQHAVLAEAARVLRPGGTFLGSDSLASEGLHHFHESDSYNPLEPSTLLLLLRALGFDHIALHVGDVLTFTARRPLDSSDEPETRQETERTDAR